jgi:hypothetical protein
MCAAAALPQTYARRRLDVIVALICRGQCAQNAAADCSQRGEAGAGNMTPDRGFAIRPVHFQGAEEATSSRSRNALTWNL